MKQREMSWSAQAAAEAASVCGLRPTWLASIGLADLMEDDVVGDGFRIANPEDDSIFLEFGSSVTARDISDDHLGPDRPWWTTTGDDPVIFDECVQASAERSAGGWSDVSAADRPWVSKWKWEPASEWSGFRLYLKRCGEERHNRFIAVFDWLRRQMSVADINKQWGRYRHRCRESIRNCVKKNEWSTLFLSSAQRTLLEAYRTTRLQILP